MILNFEDCKNKNILVYVNTISILDNCRLIFLSNAEINFYICFPFGVNLTDFNNSEIGRLSNVYLISFTDLLYKIEIIGLVISTITSAAYNNLKGIQIIPVFRALKIPIIELQHGFIQYGINYTASNEKYRRVYDFGKCEGWSDLLLSYFPVNNRNSVCIGYPKRRKYNSNEDDKGYILILTNFNWDIYSYLDISRFFSIMVKLFIKFPEHRFVWKMHPAEIKLFSNFCSVVNHAPVLKKIAHYLI